LTVIASQSSKDTSVLDGLKSEINSGKAEKTSLPGNLDTDTSSPLTPPRADK
jgi:hypothetical protein